VRLPQFRIGTLMVAVAVVGLLSAAWADPLLTPSCLGVVGAMGGHLIGRTARYSVIGLLAGLIVGWCVGSTCA